MSENVRDELQTAYWKYLLTEGERPKSVYAFMDALGREEAEFYESYANLEAVESGYWQATVDETIKVLEGDADYAEYSADQKLLAFFFTYITHIQGSRSRFVGFFPRPVGGNSGILKGMSDRFREFAKGIVGEGVQQGIFADRKKLLEYYDRFIFMHFLGIIHFYIKDSSVDFQDTDAFIEKSTHFGIQSAAHGVLESGFDFVRFMAGKDDRLKGLSKMISKFIPE
ncbi:MAG: hypothetical protein ACSHX6_14595 [Akkermansiaceae bacterium]